MSLKGPAVVTVSIPLNRLFVWVFLKKRIEVMTDQVFIFVFGC